MDSRGKRRRVHDRLSELPDCLLHSILSGLGSRQSVQTSALSRRWRQLWRGVPCADIDEREFAANTWAQFEDFADHMLTSIPRQTRLDAFRLHLVSGRAGYDRTDRWVRRGLERFPAAVDIQAAHEHTVDWLPNVPDSTMRRLTTLRLVGVTIVGFLDFLHRCCPLLKDLHVERCKMGTNVIAAPMLRRLAVVDPKFRAASPLKITAPGLAFIRLELSDEERGYCVNERDRETLALLIEASILLMEKDHEQLNKQEIQARKIYSLKSMCRFLALLPNIINLRLSGFAITVSFPINLNLPKFSYMLTISHRV
jgi:hypothetical protein